MLNISLIFNANEYLFDIDKQSTNYIDFFNSVKKTINFNNENEEIKLLAYNSTDNFTVLSSENFNKIVNGNYEDNILKLLISQSYINLNENKEKDNEKNDFYSSDSDVDINKEKDKIKKDQNKDEEDDYLDDIIKENNKLNTKQNELDYVKDEDLDDIIRKLSNEEINPSNLNQNEIANSNSNLNSIINENSIPLENIKEGEGMLISQVMEPEPDIKNIDKGKIKDDDKYLEIRTNSFEYNNSKILEMESVSSIDKEDEKEKEPNLNSISLDKSIIPNNNNLSISINNKGPPVPTKRIIKFNYTFNELCDACNSKLGHVKYICLICDNCSLCEKCESEHINHITIKYKSDFLSKNLKETFNFLDSNYELPIPSTINKMFTKEYDLSIDCMIDKEIQMRQNQTHKVPLIIYNHNKQDITLNEFDIYVKNFKNVYVNYNNENKKKIIRGKSSIYVNLICQSKNVNCRERIKVELFSQSIKFKDEKKIVYELIVDVNMDEEDEKLNQLFFGYEKIQLLKKSYKQLILYIMNEQITNKAPLEIFDILKNNKWNLSHAIPYLSDDY